MSNIQVFIEKYGDKLPLAVNWVSDLFKQYEAVAESINVFGFKRLPRYFNESHLNKVKVVLVDEVPTMPVYSKWGIEPLKEFELNNKAAWGGEAYGNMVFIRKDCIEDEGLMMHEVIHTVQYELMGVTPFLFAYGFECATYGYPDGPLEQMARKLEDNFRKNNEFFNVEDCIRLEILELKESLPLEI